MDISSWLAEFGLEKYADAFMDNDIDRATLAMLTAEDLKELGVESIGHRRVLLEAIAQLSDAAQASSPAASAERRQLSILFCDLVGFTSWSGPRDPEEVRDLIRRYQDVCKTVVSRHKGSISNFSGDGVMAQFGHPVAVEDAAMRAVRAAMDLIDAVPNLATAGGTSMSARAGVETGWVVVGDDDWDGVPGEHSAVGDIPNRAARFQSVAEPGTVLIGETTRRICRGVFELKDLGPQRIRGFDQPTRLWEAVRPNLNTGAAQPENGVLVGRGREQAELLEDWNESVLGARRTVCILGESGIGKSRVAQEFARIVESSGCPVFWIRGQPLHEGSAFFALVAHISVRARIETSDDQVARRAKLKALFGDDADEAVLEQLASMTELGRSTPPVDDPETFRAAFFDLLISNVAAHAAAKPVLVVVDDAHLLDPTSKAFVSELHGSSVHLPIMLVVASRPDWTPDWTDEASVRRIDVNRLDAREVRALVRHVADGASIDERVVSQIVARADGVPLYVEELTRACLEDMPQVDADGAAVPATLVDSLTSRLDRLGDAKTVALVAACIGRFFAVDLLERVAGLRRTHLIEGLTRLLEAGIIRPAPGVDEKHAYAFQHALVQETAYEIVLKSRRRALHARIADVLARGEIGASAAVTAKHYERAGARTEAAQHWMASIEEQVGIGAYTEAIEQARRALGLLAGGDDRSEARTRLELRLLGALGSSLLAQQPQGSDEVGEIYSTAYDISVSVGPVPEVGPVLFGLSVYYFFRAELGRVDAVCERLFALADQTDDPGVRLGAHLMRHQCAFWRADHAGVSSDAEALDRILSGMSGIAPTMAKYAQDPVVTSRICLVWSLNLRGEPDAAEREAKLALDRARSLEHPFSMAMGHQMASWHGFVRREPARVAAAAGALVALAEEQKFAMLLGIGRMLLGWSAAHEGETRGIAEEMAGALDGMLAMNARLGSMASCAALAEVSLREGAHEVGIASIEKVLAPGPGEDAVYRPELLRLKGELLRRTGADAATVRALFAEASALARAHGSRLFDLRATRSLAELTCEAPERDALARMVKSYRDASDLPDLVAARDTLERLPERTV